MGPALGDGGSGVGWPARYSRVLGSGLHCAAGELGDRGGGSDPSEWASGLL